MNEPYSGKAKYMSGPCVVCGLTNYPLSMGGPNICPACDCGISVNDKRHPVSYLKESKTTDELNAMNDLLKAELRLAKERIAELEETLREIDSDPSQQILTDAQRKILEKGKSLEARVKELEDQIEIYENWIFGEGVDPQELLNRYK